jgi:DNA invertase Pin-like site-specific DNA recombinase
MLKERGIELIAADSPSSFLDDTPTARLIRQVLGAITEFEKAMTVAKLKGARERKRRDTGKKVDGRRTMRLGLGAGLGHATARAMTTTTAAMVRAVIVSGSSASLLPAKLANLPDLGP